MNSLPTISAERIAVVRHPLLIVTTERGDDIPLFRAFQRQMQIAQSLDTHFPAHSHWHGLRLGGVAPGWVTHILWEADHRINPGQGRTAQRLETWHRALDSNLTALDFSDDRLRAGLTDLADGDRWIGLGAVGYFANANSTCNMQTGVLREYRGRKIALALKLRAIRRSREWGAAYLRTNNDSQNAPILAINQKLGYKPQHRFYRCVKVLR